MNETPFYRLKLSQEEVVELRRRSGDSRANHDIARLLRFSVVHGCLPFGRLDETLIRPDGPVSATLARTCAAAAATQRGFDFATICYVFPPVLDPWLTHQSAALLSRDGRFGLLIEYYQRERSEELAYSCTSALADRTIINTRWSLPSLFDLPSRRVELAPSRTLKDTLAHHASRIAELAVVPFAAAEVPRVVLTIQQEIIDYNVARGRFLPLSAAELERIRAVMRGDWARDLGQLGRHS
jgi:hypothetical protein